MADKGKPEDFLHCSESDLNDILKQFYAEARKMDKTEYSKSSLLAVRFGLCRYIKANRSEVDIINGGSFGEANRMFKAKITDLKKKGKAKVEHKPHIAAEDLKKFYASEVFADTTPIGLQNKVWFKVMLYFCRRGRENLRQLTKDSFGIATDATGRRYVYQKTDELTKNRREKDEAEEGGYMYEQADNSLCPMKSFEKYLSKLNPKCNALFQRPKKCEEGSMPLAMDVWYDNQVVGVHTLGNKMKILSRRARLSREYTNHSIRATSVTILDKSGFEARHIMCVSGHRQESSIRSYSKTSTEIKHSMSKAIGGGLTLSNEHAAPSRVLQSSLQPISDNQPIESSSSAYIKKPTQFNFNNCTVTIINH